MKTLILTEGGCDTGFGHLMRCAALYHGIREKRPKDNVSFFVKGDDKARKFLDNSRIKASYGAWQKDANKVEKLVKKQF